MKPFIHLEDDHPGRVVAWTSAERPTFLMRLRYENIVQLVQFDDEASADEWFRYNIHWNIVARLDDDNG